MSVVLVDPDDDEPHPKARKAKHKLIEVLDYQYVECRAMGHSWRHHKNAIGIDDPETDDEKGTSLRRPYGMGTGVIGKISQCAKCKGVRVKWISRSGETKNRYKMPPGYSRTGDEYKPTAREWRSTYVASTFVDFTHKDKP